MEVNKGKMVAHLTIFAKHESKEASQEKYQALNNVLGSVKMPSPPRAIEGRSTRSEVRNHKSQESGSPL